MVSLSNSRLIQPKDTETVENTEPQISHVFPRYRKISQLHIIGAILFLHFFTFFYFFFLQNTVVITGIETGKE